MPRLSVARVTLSPSKRTPVQGGTMRRLIPAATAVLLTAACSSGAAQSAPVVKPTHSAAAPSTVVSPSKTAASPRPGGSAVAAGGSNIVRSTAGHGLPPGPFRITPVKCGPYTAAEKAKFGTNAAGGLVFKYTNAGNTLTGAVTLDVSFMSGSTVLGENVSGDVPEVAPGQSAEGAVDALDKSGTNLTFTECELNTYSLLGQPASGSFAP